MDQQPPITLPAIRVRQPLGEFYVVAISAKLLRQIVFVDPTRVATTDQNKFLYNLLGSQRKRSKSRLKEIAGYIDTIEAAFPNSIILAANYINDGALQENTDLRWRVEGGEEGGFSLTIPTLQKMASVIDGQHRLLGFDLCRPERQEMELLCAVYMDLPHAYQAYLFATININQRKVDKSLAYEQFGYNLDDEDRGGWSPDKLAVFLSRRLNLDPKSPFHGHIKIAPVHSEELLAGFEKEWKVSTAAIVEGIIGLISSSPRTDRDALHKQTLRSRSRASLPNDAAPFRELYKSSKDQELYELLVGYFGEANTKLWAHASERSYIRKTVGIQALFDILRYIGQDTEVQLIPIKAAELFNAVSRVDFSDSAYQASGRGRVLVKNTILLFSHLTTLADLPVADRALYMRLFESFELKK